MKHNVRLSIAFSICFGLAALFTFASTASAQNGLYRFYGDTGMVTLGPNQILRLTVAPAAAQRSRVTSLTVTFSTQVTFATCSNGVCMHTVTTQNTTNPVTLVPGQAASYDIVPTATASAVRGIVRGDNADMVVNASIVDTTTGATQFLGGVRVGAGDIGGDN